MASNLRVDTILPSSGTTLGIGTASGTINFLGNSNLTTTGDVTVGGNLGVGGTLTYEDVTNIDSVGVITARSGIRIGATGANTLITGNGVGIGIGITTPQEELHIRAATPVIRLEDSDNARQSQIVGSDGNLRFDADNGNAIANTNISFRTDGSERLRITSEGYVTKPYHPAFDVCGSSGNPNASSGSVYITYNTVKINNGNHYSTSTGKFTVPVAGLYFFSFGCIKSGNSNLARLWLYKNGSSANDRHLRMATGQDGYGENGALTNIISCAVGDEIQVWLQEGVLHAGQAYLYFNGFLIG